MAKATKKYKDKKSKNSVKAQHEANRRFRQKYGVKRSMAAKALQMIKATEESGE
tara:strand:+ start:294 stop:455 length:162 start_codon:yes stop_codon:yes gene_type:complete